jgi:peptidyl-prolyl cis-trans isomerase D
MLQEIRERTQGWIAWLVILLISVPFALWGIQSYLGIGSEPVVVKIDSTEITERQLNQSVQRTRIQLRERFGAAYNADLFNDDLLRQQVLTQMVSEQVLLDRSRTLGLRTADQAIQLAILSDPLFQKDGQFDKATYERVLEWQGLTPTTYEYGLQQRLLVTQLERAITGTELITDAEQNEAVRLLQQQRDVSYIALSRDDFMPDADIIPDKEALQAFYDQHDDLFTQPEQVRIRYLLLTSSDLPQPDIDEQMLRLRYQEQIKAFTVPERRVIRHILLTIPTDADSETITQIRNQALAIRQRIEQGEEFTTLAAEFSDDTSTAQQGGSLGEIEPGHFDSAFDMVAFQLPEGVISEPVRTRFGYHLLEVTKIIPEEITPFDQVRDQLAKDLATGSNEGLFFEFAERLATLTYEIPDSLVPAAEELQLTEQVSDWIDRTGGEGLLANKQVLAAAFSHDVLELGHNSDIIELETAVPQALVLRVDDHRPAQRRSFDDAYQDVLVAFNQQQAQTHAQAAAQAAKTQLMQGADIATVADESAIHHAGWIKRDQPEIPRTVRDLAFKMPQPNTQQPFSVESTDTPTGDSFVVIVQAVKDGQTTDLDEQTQASQNQLLLDTIAQASFQHSLDMMIKQATIEYKTDDDTAHESTLD